MQRQLQTCPAAAQHNQVCHKELKGDACGEGSGGESGVGLGGGCREPKGAAYGAGGGWEGRGKCSAMRGSGQV
eukprot:357079-Chlamydomonas_euryale.AAC.9